MFFLNSLRPRLPAGRPVHVVARIALWFAGGMGLAVGMRLTAMGLATFPAMISMPVWLGGIGFVGVELVAYLGLMVRRWPNFYDGFG